MAAWAHTAALGPAADEGVLVVDKDRVALELGDLEVGLQCVHHGLEQVGQDVGRMLEFNSGEILRVTPDVAL